VKEQLQYIDLTQEQMDALLHRAEKNELNQDDILIINGLLETIKLLSQAVEDKAASIKKLLRTIFGASTEKKKNFTQKDSDKGNDQDSQDQEDTQDEDFSKKKKKSPGGHGRNGKDAYPGATICKYLHQSLKPGDICPLCGQGKVYRFEPRVLIRVTATPPLAATIHEAENLRCNLCLEIFTADIPEDIHPEKYDPEARSMIALLRYGCGFPFYRLDRFQKNLGVPLSASTQWDVAKETGERLNPVYEELVRQAAQGDVVHNDDTNMKIQQLIKENKEKDPKRKGMFTTGIVSLLQGHKIAVFFTGRNHAGENMKTLLNKRDQNLPPPIQMCDASANNIPKGLQTILANCLSHGRRKFVDILDNFPDECRHVIEQLSIVYKNDDIAKEQNMSAHERLEFHQEKSRPVMDELKLWCKEQLDEKKVEPNSGLGKALLYLQNHWEALTLFLKEPEAPLDNNICERALKMSITHRKNSMFYRTLQGARTGDLFMSFIHTCQLGQINAFDYLTQLQKNLKEAVCAPHKWLPWNYKDNLPSQ